MPVDRTTETRGVAEFSRQIERYEFLFREQNKHDEGVDAQIETIKSGYGTGRLLGVQIKTGPSYFEERSNAGFVFRFEERHKCLWTNHSLPVILCLVDLESEKVFWQHVSEGTVTQTGKTYKLIVPFSTILNEETTNLLKQLATPIVAPSDYTIQGPYDNSHGLAKRFSANIILHTKGQSWSKLEIASTVRQVTRELRSDLYCRDERVKDHFGTKHADVVWLYVYTRELDVDMANWICRSLWINEALETSHAPLPLTGEHAGDGVIIDWNNPLSTVSKFIDASKQKKSDYIPRISASIERLAESVEPIANLVKDFRSLKLDESSLSEKLVPYLKLIQREEDNNYGLGVAPNDCRQVSNRYEEILCSLSNVGIILKDKNQRKREAVAFLLEQQIDTARETLPICRYELNQVR